jgi:Amt family ammonium transporter
MSKAIYAFIGVLTVLGTVSNAWAADGNSSAGDTVFVFLATILVFIMIPGLALFYGGLARRRNTLNTMMMTFILMSVIALQWVVIGFTLAFGSDVSHLIGGFDWLFFENVGFEPNAAYAGTIPFVLFAMYQLMFAIITPALISGAVAGRMRFLTFAVFGLVWSTLVYDPVAHWVWGAGGWLRNLGVLDFAGGIVVHISSGISALVAVLVIGGRKGYKKSGLRPHNIPIALIGAGLLWFGWFGFNGGSALAVNGVAMNAFVTTELSAAAAMLSWVVVETLHRGKPTAVGSMTGAVVGLAAITPGAGYVGLGSSIIIGLVVSPLCYSFISWVKPKLGYDDALDAFGCHGVGCVWGVLATGLFASKAVNPQGADGLFYGNPSQLGIQAVGVLVAIFFSGALTWIILKAISLFMPLRVKERDETDGLDVCEHGETAYDDITG